MEHGLGKELSERIGTLAEHWYRVGQRMYQAVDAYNKSVDTLERRGLPSARKFCDLKPSPPIANSNTPAPLTQETRLLTAPEMQRAEE